MPFKNMATQGKEVRKNLHPLPVANHSYIFLCGSQPSILSKEIASIFGCQIISVCVTTFTNGEKQIRLPIAVARKEVVCFPSEEENREVAIWELLQMIDAAKRSGAESIQVIWPCYLYARQERATNGRAIPPQLLSKLLAAAGANRLLTVDLHAPEQLHAFALPTTNIEPQSIFLKKMQSWTKKEKPVLFAADESAKSRVQCLAKMLKWEYGWAEKQHLKDGRLQLVNFHGEVHHRTVFLIDDRIDSGSTFLLILRQLKASGAQKVIGWVTHGVVSYNILEVLKKAGLHRLIETSTRPVSYNPPFTIILSVADLLAKALKIRH